MLEHALTHKSQPHEDATRRRRRQRVARVPRRRGARLRDRRPALSRVPGVTGRPEVEGQGGDGLHDGAGRHGRAHRARRVPAARARRREDRRADASRRCWPTSSRRSSPRSTSTAASSRPAAFVERQIRPLLADVRRSPVLRPRPQVVAAGTAAGQRPLAAGLPRSRARPAPTTRSVFHVDVRHRRGGARATGTGRTKKDAEQEAARIGSRCARVPETGSVDRGSDDA